MIVSRLAITPSAMGLFGYSYLFENRDKIAAVSVQGVAPSAKTVRDGSYKLSRALYFYIKQSHIKKVPGILAYARLFMSEKMIADKGECVEIGLIPMPKSLLDALLNQSLQQAVASIALPGLVHDGLFNHASEPAIKLNAIRAMEKGDWDQLTPLLNNIDSMQITLTYTEAVQWADEQISMLDSI